MSSRVGIQQFISPTEPTGTQVGDEWFNSATNVLYKRSLVNGQLGWLIVGTSTTTGTANQAIGITSAGVPGFISLGLATPTAAGTVYACTPTGACAHFAVGYCAGGPAGSGCGNTAIGTSALGCNGSGCHSVAVGNCAMYCALAPFGNTAIGTCAMVRGSCSMSTAVGACALYCSPNSHQTAIGAGALYYNCAGCANVAVGAWSGCASCTGCHNSALGYQTMMNMYCGNCNVAAGYGALYQAYGTCSSVAIGVMSLKSSHSSFNIAIGHCAGCAITSGCGNVIIGGYPGTTTLSDTFVVQAGTTERIKVDATGLYINGAAFTGGGSSSSGGGSGQFNTSISNQIGYAVTDKLFDPTGTQLGTAATTIINYIVTGNTATVGVAAIMPSTTGTRYVVHSIHITNTAASDAEITGRIDHTGGYGGTATIQGSLIDHVSFFSSRLPVPSGSAVELLKKPQVLYPNDWVRLQATTPQGGTGVNGALTAYIVYEASTDLNYVGSGYILPSTSPTTVYTSALNTATSTVTATNYPSVIESVRVTNISNSADYRVTVSWTNSLGVVQSYLAYNMLIPAFATVELLEKPKRVTSGDLIRATPEAPNVLSIQASGKLITTTYV